MDMFYPSGAVNLICAIKWFCSKILSSKFFPFAAPFLSVCYDKQSAVLHWLLETGGRSIKTFFFLEKKHSAFFKPDTLSKGTEIEKGESKE